MYPRYQVYAYFNDDLIYSKRFKSLNNLLKVLSGFDNSIYFEVEDLVLDKVLYDHEIHNYIHELVPESEDY